MKKKIVFIIIVFILLTSCSTSILYFEQPEMETFILPTTTTTEQSIITSQAPIITTIIKDKTASYIEENYKIIPEYTFEFIERIPWYDLDNNIGHPSGIDLSTLNFDEAYVMTHTIDDEAWDFHYVLNFGVGYNLFLQEVCSELYQNWIDNINFDTYFVNIFAPPLATKLSQSPNIYNFIMNFDIDENLFKKTIRESTNLNEEEIDILWDKNEEVVVRTFTNEFALINGVNFYSPFWVYWNTIETYKIEGIPPQSLVDMLPKYRKITYLSEEAMAALEAKIMAYAESQ